ncbi:UNVERIFIED_CONTAM: hypothetical protein GTU68_065225 [Idotea baltica]|nr:hypothetical protein [Idotea baltica]
MGDTGPCGPCSEIFYYLGDDVNSQSKEEFLKDDGTYVEIWNLVFMQFNRQVSGELLPLPKPSVDTGMGLERVSAVMQGKRANYDSDGLRALIAQTEKMSDQQHIHDVAFRVIADHARSAAFLIADGILPGSDGRGYVLRRLIRRACRHARELGFKKPFLFEICSTVTETMGEAYPELIECKDKIRSAVEAEETRFLKTLDTGMAILAKEIDSLKAANSSLLSGGIAFQLHDTYGFPLDMTEDIASGSNVTVDSEGFREEMQLQKERSRSARAGEEELLLRRAVTPSDTEFVGYEHEEYESEISGLFSKEGAISSAKEGEEIAIVTAQTPFYAESGGQVGDTGAISSAAGSAEVLDTQKVAGNTFVQICQVTSGQFALGDKVRLEVDEDRRAKIRANHSATHLLHFALREVLGEDVKQAGSRVSDRSLRFDFSYDKPVTAEELQRIERIVNSYLRENHEVVTEVLPIEEAKAKGAMALFGEKYGKEVRVVSIGSNSIELCGGTHAIRSGDLGLVSIEQESSVSSGVRRIEAISGSAAEERLRTAKADVIVRLDTLVEKQAELEKQLSVYRAKEAGAAGKSLLDSAITLENGYKIITAVMDDLSAAELRGVADDLRSQLDTGAVALASVTEDKAIMLIALTESLAGKHHAGKIMKDVAGIVGSRGGGKADMAQAGGGDPRKLDAAFKHFQDLLA